MPVCVCVAETFWELFEAVQSKQTKYFMRLVVATVTPLANATDRDKSDVHNKHLQRVKDLILDV